MALDASTAGSWIWKSLCKLWPLARQFLIYEVGLDISAKFWFDDWTSLRPLIQLVSDRGRAVCGLHINSCISDGSSNGKWWISHVLSRSPIISLMKQCLHDAGISLSPHFILLASNTWEHVYNILEVNWYQVVWFKESIPKHAFLTWIAIRDRLPTRDRIHRWGMFTPP